MGFLKPIITSAIDFIYPRACCVCDGYDVLVKTGGPMCQACEKDLIESAENICVCCSAPVGPYVFTQNGCQHCRAVKLKFGPVNRLGIYRNLLQIACLRGKVEGGEHLIHGLARLLVREQHQNLIEVGADLVIPVPQHWRQRFRRSFNPAETIARVIASDLNVPCPTHILRKKRSTTTQKSLSVSERKVNVRDAYTVDYPLEVKGQKILLVDDVMTTGITANEITSTLRKAGSRSVSLAVIARVLQD